MKVYPVFPGVCHVLLTVYINRAMAQQGFPIVTVPASCTDGFTPGSSTALLTVPYSPQAVIGIVGDFQNLTWSGNAPSTVTLNGTDNTVGTARQYSLNGLNVVETLFQYYKPALNCQGYPLQPDPSVGPSDLSYAEAHNTAQIDFNGNNVYIPFDGISVTVSCQGKASTLNYTANFCANDAGSAQTQLDTLHAQDLQNVQAMLGNASSTDCNTIASATGCD